MTSTRAIRLVNLRLTKLRLVDRDGTPLWGELAACVVGREVGAEWSRCLEQLVSKEITPEQYVSQSEVLIERFERSRMRGKLEAILTKAATRA